MYKKSFPIILPYKLISYFFYHILIFNVSIINFFLVNYYFFPFQFFFFTIASIIFETYQITNIIIYFWRKKKKVNWCRKPNPNPEFRTTSLKTLKPAHYQIVQYKSTAPANCFLPNLKKLLIFFKKTLPFQREILHLPYPPY